MSIAIDHAGLPAAGPWASARFLCQRAGPSGGTDGQDAVRPDASHDDSRPARDGNQGRVNRERDSRSRPGAGQRRSGRPSNQTGCD